MSEDYSTDEEESSSTDSKWEPHDDRMTAECPYSEEDKEKIQYMFELASEDCGVDWAELEDRKTERTSVWTAAGADGSFYGKSISTWPGKPDDMVYVAYMSGEDYHDWIDELITDAELYREEHRYLKYLWFEYEVGSPIANRSLYTRFCFVRLFADGSIAQPAEMDEWEADPQRKAMLLIYSIDEEDLLPDDPPENVRMLYHVLGVLVEVKHEGWAKTTYIIHGDIGGWVPSMLIQQYLPDTAASSKEFSIFMQIAREFKLTPDDDFQQEDEVLDRLYDKLERQDDRKVMFSSKKKNKKKNKKTKAGQQVKRRKKKQQEQENKDDEEDGAATEMQIVD